MKKLLTLSVFSLAILFSAALVAKPEFQTFVVAQIAGVIGIDIQKVYQYQAIQGFNRDLAIGDSGKDVRLVQEALHTLRTDFPEDNITGYFGEKTSSVLASYQKAEGLSITGTVDEATRAHFNKIYFKELCPNAAKNNFENEILVRVNRDTALPKKYVPQGLVDISKIVKTMSVACLKKEAVLPLQEMLRVAARDGVALAVTSGFRRPEIQGILQTIWRSILGEETARESVAEPAHSEHQLGTTVDLSGASNGFVGGDRRFDGTPEDAWLKDNAYKYGFVMSYPEGKESITGYTYESWHYRYVGVEVAETIFDEKISVEEYFDTHRDESKKKERRKDNNNNDNDE